MHVEPVQPNGIFNVNHHAFCEFDVGSGWGHSHTIDHQGFSYLRPMKGELHKDARHFTGEAARNLRC